MAIGSNNNELYRLSPAAYRGLGVACVLVAAVFIVVFFLNALTRNKLQIQKHIQEQVVAEAAQQTTNNYSDTDDEEAEAQEERDDATAEFVTPQPEQVSNLNAIFQTLAFSLWALLLHLNLFDYTEIPVWPFYIICILAIFGSISWLQRRYPSTQQQQSSGPNKVDPSSMCLEVVLGFFAVQFFLGSAQHCFQVAPLAVYDYYGPVQVVGYNPSYIGRDGRQNMLPNLRQHYFGCPVDEAVGQIQVAWACTGKPICQAMVHSFHCDFAVCANCNGGCREEEYASTLDASNYCVQNGTYFKDSWELREQGITYDVSVQPQDNGNQFATEIMYANCNTCEAEFKEIVNQQKDRIRVGAFSILGVVFSMFCLLYFVVLVGKQRGRTRSRSVETIQLTKT